jgi:prevent-host-death family protein
MKVNMHEAKTHFSKLVERALQGEEIVVARNGKSLVRLVPVQENGGLRPIGLDKQTVAPDFKKRSMESEPLEWDNPVFYNPVPKHSNHQK